MTKILLIEEPHQGEQEHPWDENTIRRFQLDDNDIQHLEKGKVLWRGDVGFTLEELEEQK